LRFDGRVAIVTGAGRGVGRAHALLLSGRGARVVVNDLGADVSGSGHEPSVADTVVAEIAALGGEAVASAANIATNRGASDVVETALDSFGRVDIVINNAGIFTSDDFALVSRAELDRHLRVTVGGALFVTRAAWPYLSRQGYGRVLVTMSSAVFGSAPGVAYASAKAALIGMMRTLALAGESVGIGVNGFVPSAFSRMVRVPAGGHIPTRSGRAGDVAPAPPGLKGAPDAVVAPAVFLVHESCTTSGEIVASNGTNVGRLFLAATPGFSTSDLTVEGVRDNWAAICDERDYFIPRSGSDHLMRRAELGNREAPDSVDSRDGG
jgi:NAD(P)-dependent dehydrogenase (short-subunit alcohol dehydrogenase family)